MLSKVFKSSIVILVCILLPYPVGLLTHPSSQRFIIGSEARKPYGFGPKQIVANRIFYESKHLPFSESTYPFDNDEVTYSLDPPSHDSIVISNDTDFGQQGWPGSGTQNDPYRIENLIINGSVSTLYYFGINIHNTSVFFVIRNCSILNCRNGISLSYLINGLVENNTFSSNIHDGIRLTGVNQSSIANNIFSDNNYSVKLRMSHHNQVVNNTCQNTRATAIDLYNSSGNLVANNTYARSNLGAFYGMKFDESNMNTITGNVIQKSEYYIDSPQVLVENNTVDGEDLHYKFGDQGIQISNEKGQFILLNCTNIRIENCEGFIRTFNGANLAFFNNTWLSRFRDMTISGGHSFTIIGERCLGPHGGISVWRGENHTIRGNTFVNKDWGIWGYYLHNCSILNNYCYNCTEAGIQVDQSDNILISDNICTLCGRGITIFSGDGAVLVLANQCNNNVYGIRIHFGWPIGTSPNWDLPFFYSIQDCQCNDNAMAGIYLSGVEYTQILNSQCMRNGYSGISLYQSNNITIASCNCSQNQDIGINVHGQNNTIVNNNISLNAYQGLLLQNSSQGTRIQLNIFDGNRINAALYGLDTVTSFNYWSNYTGYDANNDGIGDQPHLIFSNEVTTYFDPYPLMSPENREDIMHHFLFLEPLNSTIFITGILFTIIILIITISITIRRTKKTPS